ICIGDELLIGQTLNTNAWFISQKMNETGIDIIRHISIADEKNSITKTLDEALALADVILITGGLGPTSDDITKKVLCDYFGGTLVFNEKAYENIERIFSLRQREINEATRQVAFLPDVCIPIPNKNGTAAGMLFRNENKVVVSMPGVPYEMQAMVTDYFIPYLQQNFSLPLILHKTILTAGVGETQLAERLTVFEKNKHPQVKLAYLPSVGKVKLRLTIKSEAENHAIQNTTLYELMEQSRNEVLAAIGEYVYGFDEETLEANIGKLLKDKKLTLSTAESCTGGTIAQMITSVAGSSAYFKGSVVAYSNDVKEQVLHVQSATIQRFGAVSEETVAEMLDGALSVLHTDLAIAVSGVAGPGGGSAEKPVGTVMIGIANKNQQYIRRLSFTNHRGRNIELSSVVALVMLRKFVLKYYS
ncbi:MAG TPA: competence/damage-inducible protein A, partial [Chitinophagales bacterium]|nr:competence/damage-inducible protein A [Chitinophagales bacterium]